MKQEKMFKDKYTRKRHVNMRDSALQVLGIDAILKICVVTLLGTLHVRT
jgi:hypothetical protein